MVFNVLYWAFVFLRTSASGYTAQASGQADGRKTIRLLILLSGLSAFLSLFILLLRVPIIDTTLRLVDAGTGLKALVRSYFLVRIWMIPAFLLLQTFKGWLIGMQNMVVAMVLTVLVSVLNIFFNLLFVFRLQLELEGVAWAAVTAYTVTAFTGICIVAHKYHSLFALVGAADLKAVLHLDRAGIRRLTTFMRANLDIFLRSVCILAVTSFTPIAGACFGEETLASNTILLYYFTAFSYVINGFAYVGESLSGKYLGASEHATLRFTVRRLFQWGVALSLLFTAGYTLFGRWMLEMFTNESSVVETAAKFFGWIPLLPLLCFASFVWDGILVGTTDFRTLRNSRILAAILFFASFYAFRRLLQNNALWLALTLYHVASSLYPFRAARCRFLITNIFNPR